jgi:hypothetical protein
MRRPRQWRLIVRVALVAGGAWLFARALSGVDWRSTWHVIASAGPAVVLGLVPFGVGLLLDTSGVLLAARSAGLALRGGTALAIRASCEALHFGAPGGVVASEAAAIALYARAGGLGGAEATCVVARRKELVMRAHAVYLVLGACVGAGALAAIGRAASTRLPLAWLVAASALVPLVCSMLLGAAAGRASLTRACFARFAGSRELTAAAVLAFLAGFCVEAAETAVILRLSGISLSMGSVLAVETTLSLARSAVAFVPGGLGVQDLGYAMTLAALGASHDRIAAFILLKRAKEIAWIAAGLAVSARIRARRGRHATAT